MELINTTYGLSALPSIALQLASLLNDKKVICFEGDLGAGKTTLIKSLCQVLGVQDAVSSPTFSLVNEYLAIGDTGSSTIFHIDLYRLNNEEEAIAAGIEEHLYSGSICLVEWPQRAPGIIPLDALRVILTAADDSQRHIKVLSAEN
ncbi:MAG: tRNA (adenosine(37)-N6)-threonylcarbamoyltransferase complex ATPase subunit type 1 TsaE [bacterium]